MHRFDIAVSTLCVPCTTHATSKGTRLQFDQQLDDHVEGARHVRKVEEYEEEHADGEDDVLEAQVLETREQALEIGPGEVNLDAVLANTEVRVAIRNAWAVVLAAIAAPSLECFAVGIPICSATG